MLIVLAGLPVVALVPPAHGAMLALPLLPHARPAAALVDAGAKILRPGPVEGSIVLSADRNAILPAALGNGILLLPTALTGCALPGDPA